MLPSLAELHFLNPLWLWAFILLPTLWLLYALFYKGAASTQKLKAFADEHLLPHLLKENPKHIRKSWPAITMWSLAWALTIIAMAGPRWNYRDVETFESDANMIVLLDLSKSMDAADVKPSRVALARQEIQDLIDKNRDVKIGLVAFAATPHMINPVTDDMDTITHLLPSLETELVTVQGSRLMPAFQMAAESLNAIPGTNKSLLVISDGDFDEHNMKDLIDKTLPKDVRVHTMGVGTEIGAPVPSGKGGFHKERGKVVITHLEAQKLKALAQAGNGQYFQAGPLQENASKILKTMKMKEGEKSTERTHRIWEEKFYLFLIPVLFLILPWFRRKYAFPVILMLTLNAQNAAAFSLQSVIPDGLAQWFQNKEQQGKAAFEAQDYEKAAESFDDVYRKGVAQYRAGDYASAEESFRASQRPERSQDAQYNLGNAELLQNKIEEAIKTYETLLEKDPSHEKAAHNLKVAQELLKQQEQQKQDNKKQDQQKDKNDQQDDQQKDQSDNKEKKSDTEKDSDKSKKEEESQQDQKSEDDSQKSEPNKEAADQDNKNQNQEKENQDKQEQQTEEQKKGDKPQASKQESKEEKKSSERPEEKKGQQEKPESASEPQEAPSQGRESKPERTATDINADLWLNRLKSDPKDFLKKQFKYEEKSGKNKAGGPFRPW